MHKKLTSIELFAGAGGMALGFEAAGFEHIALVENNKLACETFLHNCPDAPVFCEDVYDFADSDLTKRLGIEVGELDVLCGGAPCQSFSVAGKQLGLQDSRGILFYQFAKVLEKLRPKMFVFENVKNLLTHDGGKTFEIISETFVKAGYKISHKVLNANDFGVAQIRLRTFIVGVRNDLDGEFVWPISHDKKPVLADILLDCPASPGYLYSDRIFGLFDCVPEGGNYKDIPDDVVANSVYAHTKLGGTYFRRLSYEKPAPTLTTRPENARVGYCHPVQTRPLSVREYARIQSFPDDFEFCCSRAAAYKQIGNAVPVNLAKELACQVAACLSCL